MKKIKLFLAAVISACMMFTSCSDLLKSGPGKENVQISMNVSDIARTVDSRAASSWSDYWTEAYFQYYKTQYLNQLKASVKSFENTDYKLSVECSYKNQKKTKAVTAAIIKYYNALIEKLTPANYAEFVQIINSINEENTSLLEASVDMNFKFTDLPADQKVSFRASLYDEKNPDQIVRSNTETVIPGEKSKIVLTLSTSIDNFDDDFGSEDEESDFDSDEAMKKAVAELNNVSFYKTIWIASDETNGTTAEIGSEENPVKADNFFVVPARYIISSEADNLSTEIKNVHVIFKENITLSNNLSLNKDNYINYYFDLNKNTLSVTVTGGENDPYITFSNFSGKSLFIYNGEITKVLNPDGSNSETTDKYMLAQNSDGSLLNFTGVLFEGFNERLINQYAEGQVTVNFCNFKNCNLTRNVQGIITMFPDEADKTLAGSVELNNCTFDNCSVQNHSLFRVKGTMTVKGLTISNTDYSKCIEGETFNALVFGVKDWSDLTINGSNIKISCNSDIPFYAIKVEESSTLTVKKGSADESVHIKNRIEINGSTDQKTILTDEKAKEVTIDSSATGYNQ